MRLVAILLPMLLVAGLSAEDSVSVIRFGIPAVGIGGRPVTGGSFLSSVQIKGMLEKEFAPDGITVEWTFFKGAGPAVNEALAAHQLDVTSLGDLPALVGRSVGLKTRLILTTGSRASVYVAVPASSTARSLDDLKGKQLAIHQGTATQLLMARILAQHGLTEKDFRIVNLDTVASLAALTSGEIDGLWGSYNLYELQDRGIVRVIFDSHADSLATGKPEVSAVGTVLVAEEFAQAHPAIVQRVVDVLVREAVYDSNEDHREELFTLWSKSGVLSSTYRRAYEGVPLALRQSPLLDGFFAASLKSGAEASKALGYIRSAVDVDAWVDHSFLQQALARQGLATFWTAYGADGKPQ